MRGTKRTVDLKVDRQPVLTIMGYDPPDRSPSRMKSLISDYLERAADLINPSYSYVIKDVQEVSGNYSYIEGDITFDSEVIAGLLKQCQNVAVFALTIGGTLEKISAKIAEYGGVLKASVLDAIGSAMAEKLADIMQDRVAETAAGLGMAISRRFSPGYCDWHVSQQEMVFKALGENTGPIQLTPSSLMIPRKSVSGIIGLGPFGIADKYLPCRTCEKRHQCHWRRK